VSEDMKRALVQSKGMPARGHWARRCALPDYPWHPVARDYQRLFESSRNDRKAKQVGREPTRTV
jgi:hypothetical protein